MRRTKIICTLGPASDDPAVMKALIENGMDVARFNFSHGTHEEQKERMDKLKKLRRELKKPTAILLDTKGPEIRTGVLKDGKKVTLEEGQIFTLTTEEIVGDSTRVSQTYADLPRDLNIGDRVLIDDGLIEMTVEQIGARDVVCRVDNGGELGERKGINLPGVKVNLPPITDKDREDIKFGIEQGIDFIAASFVRNAAAINEIRKILKENDAQRTIISKVNAHYKPVIVATQMLDSMIRNPRPTRAEVSDVSNAVIQSTDAIMLSGETANGRYPVEALKTMSAIAEFTEEHQKYKIPNFSELEGEANVSSAVGVAAVQTSVHVEAKCIVTPTMSGQTPRLLCNFRPSVPIYAVTPNERACRRMQIDWGVTPLMGYQEDSTENIVSHALYVVKREKKVKPGDMVVVTAGDPATNKVRGKGNMTNMMYVVQAF